MRFSLTLALFLGCAGPRESVRPAAPVDVAQLRAQLASVTAPSPRDGLRVRLARSLATPVHLDRADQAGVSLEITALGVPPIELARNDERTSSGRAGDLEIVHLAGDGRFEELRRISHEVARIELPYAIALGPMLASLRVHGARVEALDGEGVARLRSEPAFAIDARGTVRALLPELTKEGVTWSADARDLVPPIAIDPAWTATKSLAIARRGEGAFTLPGKKVMVVGSPDGESTGEIYDDATGSWTFGPSLSRERRIVPPVQLDDGRIFAAFGVDTDDPGTGEVYDPSKGTWKAIAPPPISFFYPAVCPLAGAKVLVASRAGVRVYDAKTDTWSTTGDLVVKRNRATCARLPDGRVFLIGGLDAAGARVSAAELYDPPTGTFSSAGAPSALRSGASFGVLGDGHVVLAGGGDGTEAGTVLDTVQLFDPATKTWSEGPKLGVARSFAGSGILSDGRMMVAGGNAAEMLLDSAEILDLPAMKWIPAGKIHHPRATFPIVPIAALDPRALAIGGYDGAGVADVDVFAPQAFGKPCTEAGECDKGSCVDGVCCSTSACAADETCGGSASPGSCKKRNGIACTTDGECGSAACVDGVCCDGACTGSCEACDVASSKGTCTVLSPGDAPHGALRARCPGDGVCAALCGGVDAKTCTLFPGAATECGAAACKDGQESTASTCDGTGKCAAAPKDKCEPYACGDTACKRACAVDGDCATGYSCDARSGKCVFGAKCDGEHTVQVPGAPSIDCTPYRCAGASCIQKCATSEDCIAGTTCDPSSGACVIVDAGNGDDGGCAFGTRSRPTMAWMGLALVGLGVVRRRRA
jgi:hypothetical protein